MKFVQGLTLAAAACALTLGLSAASAQTYPDKPIRIITSSVGGGGDLASRIIAQGVTKAMGQPLVVENRSSTAASEAVAHAAPDGYTVLITGSSFWIGPLLRDASYDPMKDYRPVTVVSQAALVVVAHPSLPASNIAELIDLAKAQPGALNYGSGSPGGGTHLAGEMFKTMTGTEIVNIPFSDDAALLQSLLSGDLQLAWVSSASVAEQVAAGSLKVLATTGAEPSSLYPEAPTVAETVPGYVSVSMTAMFAPAGTPDEVVTKLSTDVSDYLHTPEAAELFQAQGVEPVGSAPEDLSAAMEAEVTRLTALIEQLGLREGN